MKTRLLLIIGIIFAIGITFALFYAISIMPTCIEGRNLDGTCNEPMRLPLSVYEYGKQKKCKDMGGAWNHDHCLITQETFDSKKLTCEPGPVLEDGTCQSDGIKLVFESVVEPELENENYPFGLTGPTMNQETCNDFVISQWQPRVEDREMVQQFLEICIQRGFMTPELVERGKVADNFTFGPIQSAQTLAEGDIEKTIEILEEMYREQTIENLKEPREDYIKSTVHVSVDKEEYHTDDVVMISGYVENTMPNTELNITIRNPLMDMVFVSQVKIFDDGTFTESLSIGGLLWKQNGIYSISAQYGEATDHTDFLYLSDLESDDLL